MRLEGYVCQSGVFGLVHGVSEPIETLEPFSIR
jgi:hypothetical protein